MVYTHYKLQQDLLIIGDIYYQTSIHPMFRIYDESCVIPRGVAPCVQTAEGEAPCRSSAFSAAVRPRHAAACSAVRAQRSRPSTRAPPANYLH